MKLAELMACLQEPILQSSVDKIRSYAARMTKLRAKPLTKREAIRLDILKRATEADFADLDLSVMPIFWKSPDDYNSGGVEFQHAVWRLGRLADELEKMVIQPPTGDGKPWLRPAKKGWVYFLSAGSFIKIGYATDVVTRIRGLETGSPVAITLLHKERGNMEDEARYHKRFADLRERGEWFRNEGDLAAHIASVAP